MGSGCKKSLMNSVMEHLAQLAASDEQCDGTPCPAGCCPEVDWYCCPDNLYCAATAADCPFVAAKEYLTKLAAKKQCDGTPCPLAAAQRLTGTVALTTCTALPLLLTVPL